MKTSYGLFIVCALVLHHQAKAQSPPPLLGRPDGHDSGLQEHDSAESDDHAPLLGRRDGHELAGDGDAPLLGRRDGHEPAGDGDAPLLGRRDGHEPESWQEKSEDTSDGESDDESDDEYDEVVNVDDGFDDEDEEEQEEEPVENGEEPLVRCKRPMCLMYCENGFETDTSGCPVCQCKKSDSGLIGRPDGHEPAVAICKDRPVCDMYCENGFKLGDNGCPICECNNTEHSGILDPSDGHELAPDCENRPLCRMLCSLGFQTDEDGCPVCSCLEDPCQLVDCPPDAVCRSQPCESRSSCTKLSAKCVAAQQSLPCPEPMCADACPDGYLKNEQGCMTCQCAPIPDERLCGVVTCEKGQICRNVTGSSVPKCTVKTICETQRERPVALGGTSLQCEADGSFKPLQCNSRQADCWCVDGLGQEIAGTRSTVYIEEHKPKCLRNITVSMHVHLTLIVKHDVDITNQMGSLNTTIVDHVSSWLLVEPHYITVVKAEAVTSGESKNDDGLDDDGLDDDESYDYNSDDTSDELDGSRLLVVELVVMHDGQVDLPSAANYMKQRMNQGLCQIPFDKGSLIPNPYSLKTEHRFSQQLYEPSEVIYEPDRCDVEPDSWYCWRKQHMCSVGMAALISFLVILTLLMIIVATTIYRRRRMRMLAFRHRVLESQTSVDRSFLDDDAEKPLPVDGDTYPTKEEKLPIA